MKTEVIENGMNGKLSEIQSALGILNLNALGKIINKRKKKYILYYNNLKEIDGIRFQQLKYGKTNYSYFPIVFENENILLKVEKYLNNENIFPRRYFYPSVNKFEKIVNYEKKIKSEYLANRILCLPLFYDLNEDIIQEICNTIKKRL